MNFRGYLNPSACFVPKYISLIASPMIGCWNRYLSFTRFYLLVQPAAGTVVKGDDTHRRMETFRVYPVHLINVFLAWGVSVQFVQVGDLLHDYLLHFMAQVWELSPNLTRLLVYGSTLVMIWTHITTMAVLEWNHCLLLTEPCVDQRPLLQNPIVNQQT